MLVSQFLINLKARGQIQAAQTVLSDADFIRFANDQLRMVICPKILSVRQNYFVGQKDYALTGRRRYRLPSRILGNRISLVTIINGTDYYDLPQVYNTAKASSYAQGFYLSQGDLIITGELPTGTMRVLYGIRPPKMSSAAVSLALVTVSGSSNITVGTSLSAGTYQVIRSGSPYRTISPTVSITTFTGTDTDCSVDYERFAVGDIVITADSTHIVPLEDELCDWLLQRTNMRIIQALGQTDQLQAAGSKLADIERDCLALISPRVQNSPKVINGMQLAGWR